MTAESPYEGRLRELPENPKVLRRVYPGWGVLVDKLTEPSLRANDVGRILGLSYRQIFHWDSRKLLWGRQASSREWRRFSIADIFGLALVKKVANLGIPFDKLKASSAIQMGVLPSLRKALPHLLAGGKAYLCTDFENSLYFMPVGGSPGNGQFIQVDSGNPRPLVLLPVQPILAELAKKLDLPDFKVSINPDGRYSFEISGVPLRLEDLKYAEEGKTTVNAERKRK